MIVPQLTDLVGAGPKTMARLNKLGIVDIPSLLFHLPHRYEDRTRVISIKDLQVGESATVVGRVVAVKIINAKKAILQCMLDDSSGCLILWFFNYSKLGLYSKLKQGTRLCCYGEIKIVSARFTMMHPEYRILTELEPPPMETTLTPVYPTTAGLSQMLLRRLMTQGLVYLSRVEFPGELLVEYIQARYKLPGLVEAIPAIHKPPRQLVPNLLLQRNHPIRQRIIFEELLVEQLRLVQIRLQTKQYGGYIISWQEKLASTLYGKLPFTLTTAQLRAIAEIRADMTKSQPMVRLLQGDVGSGKTIVAMVAAVQVAAHGLQVAIMVPTEILARQHFKNVKSWLESLNIKSALLCGNTPRKERITILRGIARGEIQLIIGTHALFQLKVKFHQLGLVIIDEQHRFGVHQRLQLRDKGLQNNHLPHQLIMSATPIPRTMARMLYADLDCSIIDELPQQRIPIKTLVLSNSKREAIINYVRRSCREGGQIYWICPLIDVSEHLQCQAAEQLAKELAEKLPELKVGLLHGRLPAEQKDIIMLDFLAHHIDLLVATTVVEVGVDVANANLMIIENAERLGMIQLHQLRGRVGRGARRSQCILLYQDPLQALAKVKLQLLRDHNDGFLLARRDLELRGSGEILGTRQSGLWRLKVADLLLDQHMLPWVQEVSERLVEKHPQRVVAMLSHWNTKVINYGEIS